MLAVHSFIDCAIAQVPSFADLQNVAAFTCVEALGAFVDIPKTCAADGIGLKVRTNLRTASCHVLLTCKMASHCLGLPGNLVGCTMRS